MHPEILIALNRERIAELRRARYSPGRFRPARPAGRAARERVGWLLVEVGLRIVARRAEGPAPPRVTVV